MNSSPGHAERHPCRLRQQNGRAGEDDQRVPAPPAPRAEPAVFEAEPEAVADRLADLISARVPCQRLGDDGHRRANPVKHSPERGFLDLLADEPRHSGRPDGEVVAREPPGGSGATSGEERGIFAEENSLIRAARPRPYEMIHRPGGGGEVGVSEGPNPGVGPAGGEPARVLGERHDRPGRPLQAEAAEPRDARARGRPDPGNVPAHIHRRDAVGRRDHEDFPPRGLPQRFQAEPHRARRVARGHDHAQCRRHHEQIFTSTDHSTFCRLVPAPSRYPAISPAAPTVRKRATSGKQAANRPRCRRFRRAVRVTLASRRAGRIAEPNP